MERYGAYNAAALDGGTSSVMVENYKIINDPINSDGVHKTRPVATAWGLILDDSSSSTSNSQIKQKTIQQTVAENKNRERNAPYFYFILAKGLLSTAFLICELSTCVYISVVEILSCPNNSCNALISTFPYLYIRVAAVCLNLCTEYLLVSSPALFSSCFTILDSSITNTLSPFT